MFLWGVLKRRIPESVRFCIGDLPMYIFLYRPIPNFTVSCLFTFVREGMMYVELNSVTLFTVLYSRFLNCAKDVSKVTAQPTILE